MTDFRAINFSAGPASLPTAVLEKAQAEMLNWQGMGVSVMEMSHRSKEFISIAQKAEADLRELLAIPENYQVLFVQGGASLQFAAIPLNIMHTGSAAFIDTGIWSEKAIKEVSRYGQAHVIGSSDKAKQVPSQAEVTAALAEIAQNHQTPLSYLHYCPNETINGVAFDYVPNVPKTLPLVADMSSCILSQPIDVSQFGVIYAGAQKNIGPAGLTIVIVRDDLLDQANPLCPSLLNYKNQAEKGSMLNTPATYSWYLAGLVFEWIKAQGGVSAMSAKNTAKAKRLYDFIDASDFYHNNVATNSRSIMNVPFTLADDALNETFLTQASAQHLLNLKGHRSVGGMRASMYNAMSLEQVDALVEFMADFANIHKPV